MKNFLALEKFKELKILFILEIILTLLIIMLISVNNIHVNFFDWEPLLISLGIWSLSSLVDKEKYFNLATFIVTGTFCYMVFWFMFNVII